MKYRRTVKNGWGTKKKEDGGGDDDKTTNTRHKINTGKITKQAREKIKMATTKGETTIQTIDYCD